MFSKAIDTVGLALLCASTAAAQTCDPLTTTCSPNPGLSTSSYSVDFTKSASLPDDWTIASWENVTFSSQGAEFTFNKSPDAPYMWTSFYIFFGHVDVVLQASPGTGLLSSSILLSDDGDEIDWEFSGNNFGYGTAANQGHVQTNFLGKGITGNYDRGTQPASNGPQLGFHTYSLDWNKDQIVWSVDGNVLRTLNAADCDNGTHQYPQTPMQLHLGLWDAGDDYVDNNTATWAGGRTDKSQAPFTYVVKSVSITNNNPGKSYTYSDQSGTWQSIKIDRAGNSSSSNVTLASTASDNAKPSVVAGTSANSAATFTSSDQGAGNGSASASVSAVGYSATSGAQSSGSAAIGSSMPDGYGGYGGTSTSYASSGKPSTSTSTSLIPGSTVTVASSSNAPSTTTSTSTSYYSTTTIVVTPGQTAASSAPVPASVSVVTSTAVAPAGYSDTAVVSAAASTTPAPMSTPAGATLTTMSYGSASMMSYPACCSAESHTINCVTWTSVSGSTQWTTLTSSTTASGSATSASAVSSSPISTTATLTVMPSLPFCNAATSTACYKVVTTTSTCTSGSSSGSVTTAMSPSIVPSTTALASSSGSSLAGYGGTSAVSSAISSMASSGASSGGTSAASSKSSAASSSGVGMPAGYGGTSTSLAATSSLSSSSTRLTYLAGQSVPVGYSDTSTSSASAKPTSPASSTATASSTAKVSSSASSLAADGSTSLTPKPSSSSTASSASLVSKVTLTNSVNTTVLTQSTSVVTSGSLTSTSMEPYTLPPGYRVALPPPSPVDSSTYPYTILSASISTCSENSATVWAQVVTATQIVTGPTDSSSVASTTAAGNSLDSMQYGYKTDETTSSIEKTTAKSTSTTPKPSTTAKPSTTEKATSTSTPKPTSTTKPPSTTTSPKLEGEPNGYGTFNLRARSDNPASTPTKSMTTAHHRPGKLLTDPDPPASRQHKHPKPHLHAARSAPGDLIPEFPPSSTHTPGLLTRENPSAPLEEADAPHGSSTTTPAPVKPTSSKQTAPPPPAHVSVPEKVLEAQGSSRAHAYEKTKAVADDGPLASEIQRGIDAKSKSAESVKAKASKSEASVKAKASASEASVKAKASESEASVKAKASKSAENAKTKASKATASKVRSGQQAAQSAKGKTKGGSGKTESLWEKVKAALGG
ncbi:MAG: hypothetical protein M1828_000956 [Chrysothrix sp. TS-e1954]|nr:MAG: hypothetical protein M1828_000956 [Chrysothrix sp. TS-e1954]